MRVCKTCRRKAMNLLEVLLAFDNFGHTLFPCLPHWQG